MKLCQTSSKSLLLSFLASIHTLCNDTVEASCLCGSSSHELIVAQLGELSSFMDLRHLNLITANKGLREKNMSSATADDADIMCYR
jgi:hypothetical protein